jgi:hypothetical protein
MLAMAAGLLLAGRTWSLGFAKVAKVAKVRIRGV